MPYNPRLRRSSTLAAAAAVILAALTGLAMINHGRGRTPAPPPPPASSPAPQWTASTPTVPTDVHVAWAYLDSTDGTTRTSGDTGLHDLGRLLVPAAAETYLDHAGTTPTPDTDATVAAALAGDTPAGGRLIGRAGGLTAVAAHTADACALPGVKTTPPQASVLDIARYAACLREGAITDPATAARVLDKMRDTAGGIGDVRGNDGNQRLAQFNATAPAGTGRTRTACMGIGAYWSAAVLVDYPATWGALYGTSTCADVAAAEFPPDTQPAPESGSPAPDVGATNP